MGFDVTAANIIFFIAFLGIGSVSLGGYWANAEQIEEARRIDAQRAQQLAHTNLTVTSATYDSAAARFSVDVRNSGSTVVDLSDLVYLVDGVFVDASAVESLVVVGVSGATDVWLPLETIELDLAPIASSPSAFQLVAANGARANWRI